MYKMLQSIKIDCMLGGTKDYKLILLKFSWPVIEASEIWTFLRTLPQFKNWKLTIIISATTRNYLQTLGMKSSETEFSHISKL